MEQKKAQRRSIRLKGHDYSEPGFYFVTICTKDRKNLFGEIQDGKMVLSELGKAADQCWQKIPEHFPDVRLWEYVVMPNHVHGILEIIEQAGVGAQNFVPLHSASRQNHFQKIIPRSIGSIIRGYKIGVTKWAREMKSSEIIWQRNFYDRIIRDENELNLIREYVILNPVKWEYDRENILEFHGDHHQITGRN